MLETVFIAVASSAIVASALVMTKSAHIRVTGDQAGSGPQKLHHGSVPRVGGIAIFAGFCIALALSKIAYHPAQVIVDPVWLMFALFIPFAAGILEDCTQRVRPFVRLLATMAAAAIAYFFCAAVIVRFDVPLVDALLAMHPAIAFVFTLFCVAGVAHAYNLADGLNGLLGGLVCAAAAGLALVGWKVGDLHIVYTALALGGATLGFLFLNFPVAKLFAGDGGAYFAGTAIAVLSILLIARNPALSPWVALAMVLYPFADTTSAIVRRVIRRKPISEPDAEHLHTLLALELCRTYPRVGRNMASALIVFATTPFVLFAAQFARHTAVLVAVCFSFFVLYGLCYGALRRAVVRRSSGGNAALWQESSATNNNTSTSTDVLR